MADLKKLTWELQDFTGKRVWGSEDLLTAHRIAFTTSNGGRITVEMYEREPGVIEVRALDGFIEIMPTAANTIQVRNRTYYEREVEHQAREKEKKKRGNRR